MHIEELTLNNFRCFSGIKIKLDPSINFFSGLNGAGKTSILESLFFLTHGRGFHYAKPRDLRKWNTDLVQIATKVNHDNSNFWMGLGWDNEWSARLNGKSVKSISKLLLELPLTVFNSDSVNLISGSSEYRRQFLDYILFHVKHDYKTYYSQYKKVLSQRNAALKMGLSVNPWNEQFCEFADLIDNDRLQLCNRVSDILDKELSLEHWVGSDLKLSYKPGWTKDSSLEQALVDTEISDRKRGFTQVGPHRADFSLYFRDHKAKQTVSRGEQKWICAALMLSSALILQDLKHITPVVLLDDPFSELDSDRANALLEASSSMGFQLLITGVEVPHCVLDKKAKVFHVEHENITVID